MPDDGLETCSDNEGEEGTIMLTVCRVGVPKQEMRVPPDIDVLSFKRRAYPDELEAGSNIRVIYMGKMLPDSTRLDEAKVGEGAVLHVMISNVKSNALEPNNDKGYDTDEQVLRDHEMAQRLAGGGAERE